MDNELFWKLLEPEHPRAEAFCRRLTQNRDEGDDLYQDALLTAMRNLGSLRDHDSFRPWLYRIIVNAFKNRHRRSWWRRHAPLNPDVTPASAAVDPRDRLAARRWLERAFRALNADERSLVVLFELEQWSIDELAELYHSSRGAIKARLFRCRRKMRKELTRHLLQTENAQSLKEAEYALSRGETPAE